MRILGLDPGIATTGFGLIDKIGNRHQLVAFGTITTKAGLELPDRLKILAQELGEIITTYQPECAAVEQLFFNSNTKTAMTVAQARGVILLTLAQANLSVANYTPPQVKSAVCGYGQADKKQVQYMVQKLLKMTESPKQDDAADALAIAICHSHNFCDRRLSQKDQLR
jgi:crossover junction endodeoxyribonuclease RuvC